MHIKASTKVLVGKMETGIIGGANRSGCEKDLKTRQEAMLCTILKFKDKKIFDVMKGVT